MSKLISAAVAYLYVGFIVSAYPVLIDAEMAGFRWKARRFEDGEIAGKSAAAALSAKPYRH